MIYLFLHCKSKSSLPPALSPPNTPYFSFPSADTEAEQRHLFYGQRTRSSDVTRERGDIFFVCSVSVSPSELSTIYCPQTLQRDHKHSLVSSVGVGSGRYRGEGGGHTKLCQSGKFLLQSFHLCGAVMIRGSALRRLHAIHIIHKNNY